MSVDENFVREVFEETRRELQQRAIAARAIGDEEAERKALDAIHKLEGVGK